MATRGRRTGSAVWIAASAAAHAFTIYALPRPAPIAPASRVATPVDLVLEVEPAPPAPTPQAPTPPAPPSRTPDEAPRRLDPPPAETPDTQPPPDGPVGAGTPPDAPPTGPTQTPESGIQVAPGRLDPRAVALAALDRGGPTTPRAATPEPSAVDPTARDAELSRALSQSLTAAANARPEGFGRRELPAPTRRPDGTLAYAITDALTAVVHPDGSFTFGDVDNVRFGGMGNEEREGMQVGWGLEEWMMRRHGDDPHASLRRWFARETETMRDGMADRFVDRQAAAAARGMRGRLLRMVADEALAVEERRRRVFAAWDDCSEGERVGDAVRAAIVELVREQFPEGGDRPYLPAELERLNRDRESTAEFRPYAR